MGNLNEFLRTPCPFTFLMVLRELCGRLCAIDGFRIYDGLHENSHSHTNIIIGKCDGVARRLDLWLVDRDFNWIVFGEPDMEPAFTIDLGWTLYGDGYFGAVAVV